MRDVDLIWMLTSLLRRQALYTLVEMPSQIFPDEKVRTEEYLDGYDDPVLVGCEDYEPTGVCV